MNAFDVASAAPQAALQARPWRAKRPISAWPKLRLAMLRDGRACSVFPFDQSELSCFYLARNGIVALAEAFSLRAAEVLMPAYCHGIEVQALLHAGASTRFYAVRENMTVQPEDVIAQVRPGTRAVYLIHYVGFPGPVQELAAFCRSRGLLLIEDCALALFSKLDKRPLGSFGDASIFCFYKTLPLPNGGAVLLNRPAALPPARKTPTAASTLAYTALAALRPLPRNSAKRMDSKSVDDRPSLMQRAAKRALSPFGLSRVGSEALEPGDTALGMSRLCHRIIRACDADVISARRRQNYLHLAEKLADVTRIVRPALPDGTCPLFFAIHTTQKRKLRERLLAHGIETVDLWRHHAPGVREGQYREVDELRRGVLEIPCHQDLTSDDMDRIAQAIIDERAFL